MSDLWQCPECLDEMVVDDMEIYIGDDKPYPYCSICNCEMVNIDWHFEELIDNYFQKRKCFIFEGDNSCRYLEMLFRDLGYKNEPYKYGNPIERFLSDNSGAVDAILDWIKNNDNPDWREKLENLT